MTATNAAGSNTATKTIVVNSVPTVTTSNQTICAGQSATLTAAPSAVGGTYLWSNGSSTSTTTVNPSALATYTVIYTLNGCSSSPASASVTVNPTPVVTVNNQTICTGSTATLSASSTTPGGTYLWSTGANTSSISVNPTSNSTYTVTYTVNNCPSSPATSTVTITAPPTVTANNPTICSGQSTNVSATSSISGGTYSWSNGGSGASISVTPTNNTNYTVTYSLPGCPQVTATSTVTVNTTPTISLSNKTICMGQNVTLKASTNPTGGTFIWTPGGSSSTVDSLVVSPTTQTTYTALYTLNGCSSTASSTVSVNPNPIVIASDQSICAGGTATLTATSNINGTIFNWSTGANTSSISISPSTNTTYTVIGSANGCVSQTDTVKVTITTAPVVTVNNATICSGNSATLNATTSVTGGSFTWSNNANGASIVVSPTSQTSYTVSYSLNGCSPVSANAQVTVNPTPSVSAGPDTIVCQSDLPITLTATSSTSGVTYIWSNGAATANSLVTAGGSYTVTGTLNGCSSTDVVIVTTDPCAEIIENEILYSVYPNPTNGLFYVKSSTSTNSEIELLNIEGKIIFKDRFIGNNKTINLSSYENGLYIVKILDTKKSTVFRVVKQ
jgi:hypothetical protein